MVCRPEPQFPFCHTAAQGMDTGGIGITPSTGAYTTPSPGGRTSAPPPPAPKGAGGVGGRPAWPATNTPGLPVTTGGGLALPSTSIGGPQRKFVDEGKLRKVSGKLFAEPASVLKQLRWQGGGSGGGEAGEPGSSMADMAGLPGVPRGQRSTEGQAQALPLLQALGEGYRLLCMYRCVEGGPKWQCSKRGGGARSAASNHCCCCCCCSSWHPSSPPLCPCRCQEAIEAFSRLPLHHYQTGWVLCCVGRSFFEMVDYPEAAKAFNWARQVRARSVKGVGGVPL